MKRKMVATRFQGFEAMLSRIGRTSRERLEWIVQTAQRKHKHSTEDDCANLQLELAAFTWLGNPLPSWYVERLRRFGASSAKPHPLEPVPESVIPLVLNRLRKNLELVVLREPHHPVGETNHGVLWRVWDEAEGRWKGFTLRHEMKWDEWATLALDRLIELYGHLVKGCPAPAVRAKTDEICGRWFVAKRPNQEYCSTTCQSRASTRAARSGTETAATKRRKAAML